MVVLRLRACYHLGMKKTPKVEAIVLAGGRVVERKVMRLVTPRSSRGPRSRRKRKGE
jgi:hypothetical protein